MIRPAEEKDIKRMQELLIQVNNVHASKRPDIFIPDTVKYSVDELKDLIQDALHPIFVYIDDHEIVQGYAFCQVQEFKNDPHMADRKTLYIDDICVDSECRRQHIGRQLYEYVYEYAKAENFTQITLNVWELNGSARAFYESVGMVPLKTTMEVNL